MALGSKLSLSRFLSAWVRGSLDSIVLCRNSSNSTSILLSWVSMIPSLKTEWVVAFVFVAASRKG